MQETYDTLTLSYPVEHILKITLDRPDSRNAMNTQMGRDILDVATSLILNPASVRIAIITGAGEKAFCAGGDLKERNGMTDEAWRLQHSIFEQAVYRLMDSPIPIIAAVNGAAFGGGCEIALACDFIYAASNARFALTEVSLGIIPGAGGTQNLPRAAGIRRAKEILYTSYPFSAKEGYEWGIVNKVCAPNSLLEEVLSTAIKISENAPLSVRQAKRAIDLGMGTDRVTGLGIEIEAYNRLVPTDDRREGIKAFNEKRKPNYKGR